MSSGYKKRTTWEFEVLGETLAVVDKMPDWVEVEETRKNGQEDTHMCEVLIKTPAGWVFESDLVEYNSFREYGGVELCTAIREFLDKHGAPVE